MQVKDKTIVVTGAATGIGRALALAFARAARTVWPSPTSTPRAPPL